MVREQLEAILRAVESRVDAGWQVMPEGRSVTLYAAKDGVGLNVNRVEAIQVEGAWVNARTQRGEIYVLALVDIFAASTDADGSKAKKAGFV